MIDWEGILLKGGFAALYAFIAYIAYVNVVDFKSLGVAVGAGLIRALAAFVVSFKDSLNVNIPQDSDKTTLTNKTVSKIRNNL